MQHPRSAMAMNLRVVLPGCPIRSRYRVAAFVLKPIFRGRPDPQRPERLVRRRAKSKRTVFLNQNLGLEGCRQNRQHLLSGLLGFEGAANLQGR